MTVEVTILGCGSSGGVPLIGNIWGPCDPNDFRNTRRRVSILVKIKNKTFLIDTSPDLRMQMLDAKVKNIDAVLYTHSHKDHVAGLDDIRSFNFRSRKPMDIFCTKDVLNALKMEYSYIFSEKTYPGVPKVNINIIENTKFFVDDIEIQPIQALHYKLPVLGFRIKNFIYLTDLSEINSVEKSKMLNADVIVLDSLRKEPHLSHLSLDESIALLKELKPKQAYLIHISHLMGIHDQVNSELPTNIQLSYDGLQLNI